MIATTTKVADMSLPARVMSTTTIADMIWIRTTAAITTPIRAGVAARTKPVAAEDTTPTRVDMTRAEAAGMKARTVDMKDTVAVMKAEVDTKEVDMIPAVMIMAATTLAEAMMVAVMTGAAVMMEVDTTTAKLTN